MSDAQVTPYTTTSTPPPGLDTCSKCKFYNDDGSGQQGECRETAPPPSWAWMTPTTPVGAAPRTMWPIVLGSDWCGEWQARAQPAAGLDYVWDGATTKPAAGSGYVRVQVTQTNPGTLWASVVGSDGIDRTTSWQAVKSGTIIRITDTQDSTIWVEYAATGVPSIQGGVVTVTAPTYRNTSSTLKVPSVVRVLLT